MSFVGGMCYHGEVAERRKQHGLLTNIIDVIEVLKPIYNFKAG